MSTSSNNSYLRSLRDTNTIRVDQYNSAAFVARRVVESDDFLRLSVAERLAYLERLVAAITTLVESMAQTNTPLYMTQSITLFNQAIESLRTEIQAANQNNVPRLGL